MPRVYVEGMRELRITYIGEHLFEEGSATQAWSSRASGAQYHRHGSRVVVVTNQEAIWTVLDRRQIGRFRSLSGEKASRLIVESQYSAQCLPTA